MVEIAIKVLMCHMIGDYVLQTGFIAKTKGENWYHLFVHCVLYCAPFYLCFGCTIGLLVLFISHFLIDMAKARYKVIGYIGDQVLHYSILCMYAIIG